MDVKRLDHPPNLESQFVPQEMGTSTMFLIGSCGMHWRVRYTDVHRNGRIGTYKKVAVVSCRGQKRRYSTHYGPTSQIGPRYPSFDPQPYHMGVY